MNHSLKRQVREQRRARQEKQIIMGIAAAGILLLLFGVAYVFWNDNKESTAAFTYRPADVIHEKPIRAVHDMNDGPPIPFLPSGGPQPKITVSEIQYNFGSIGAREIVQRTFAIRNDGQAPLTISRAYTTCGCTVADFTATVIAPGKVSEITLIFDAGAHDSRGQIVRRGLIIENNDPRQSQVEIWIQAAVRTQ
jgi:hypothetical protein